VLQLLFSCLIFSIPLNLFLKLNESSSYVGGLKIDYLISKIYLTDIFIGLILLSWLLLIFKKNRRLNSNYLKKDWLFLIKLVILLSNDIIYY